MQTSEQRWIDGLNAYKSHVPKKSGRNEEIRQPTSRRKEQGSGEILAYHLQAEGLFVN